MDTGMVAVILIFGVIVPTAIVFHYLTKWRETKSLSGEDEKLLQDLWQSADKIDKRINTLERILDADTPDWRNRRGGDD